jgi:type IV pilus assembly protein PilB
MSMSSPVEEKRELAERLVHGMILDAYADNAHDVHLEPLREGGLRLRYRREDDLQEIRTFSPGVSRELREYLKRSAGLDTETTTLPQRGSLTMEAHEIKAGLMVALKLGILPTISGERITLSIDPYSPHETFAMQDFEALGCRDSDLALITKIFDRPFGLIVVTGTAGSGRTTTCRSALNHIRRRTSEKAVIIALEEAIAYPLEGIAQVHVEPKEGQGYYENLQAALWQDPDVIFIEALRDRETARLVCEIALTGHLVIVQMDSPDIMHALVRLLALIGDSSLLASILEGVIAQRLIRCICPACCEEYGPPQEIADRYFLGLYRKWFKVGTDDAPLATGEAASQGNDSFDPASRVSLFRGRGCEKCHRSGFSGRTALFEVMEANLEIKDLISRGPDAEKLKETLLEKEFLTLREKALCAALSGSTTLEEALRVTYT